MRIGMYVRTISRHNKDGSTTTYVQLAHNIRDPKTGQARAQVLRVFGRADSLDVVALKRLVRSLCRFLSPEDAIQAQASVLPDAQALRFIKSVPMGGAYVLRALWERLGLEEVLSASLHNRGFLSPLEWTIFAMVANRALSPDSRREVEEWVREDVALGNPEPVSLQHLYRAMDFLMEHEETLQKEVFFATANLLNLLEFRPLYHHPDDRIRAHVLICFLALLLVRVAERHAGRTWDHIRAIVERIHLWEFISKDGHILRRTKLTHDQSILLKLLNISPPPLIQKIDRKP